MIVQIASDAISEMLAHARDEAPNECCGLLIGTRGSVARAVRTRNLEASPTRFLIDPEDHFAAMRAARLEHLQVIGAYHSHPAGVAAPSVTDVAEASGGWEFLYVIVSPVEEAVTAYYLRSGEVQYVRIEERASS